MTPRSRFLVPLRVTPLDDGRTWVLLSPFTYEVGHLGSGQHIHVPPGFRTDFASTPRAVWWILPKVGRYTRAAVLHDYLYSVGTTSRRDADHIFREAMGVSGVNPVARWAMWAAVRSPGGWLAWRSHRRSPRALHLDPRLFGDGHAVPVPA
jgi:hypothetical protein